MKPLQVVIFLIEFMLCLGKTSNYKRPKHSGKCEFTLWSKLKHIKWWNCFSNVMVEK